MKHLKDNGFTLIEIIAVIVVMGILLMVVFPATTRIMKSNDEKKYDTYYDIVQAGLEKEARTRRNEVGGTVSSGCIDDKTLTDLINEGYVKEYDLDDDILCETVSYFSTAQLSSWGIDTSKDYASMMVIGDHGNISTRLSLICVKKYENGTFASEPEYVKLIEKGECSATVAPPSPPTPDTPATPTTYTITYDANGGSSCTKETDTLSTGQSVDLTPTCTRSNYIFNGWSTIKNGAKVTTLTVGEENITLYAKWVYDSSSSSTPTYSNNCSGGTYHHNSLTQNHNYFTASTSNTAYNGTYYWTNQTVRAKLRYDSSFQTHGTFYNYYQNRNWIAAEWEYSEPNVEIEKDRRKINGLGPNGDEYVNVELCVFYDSKKPVVTFEDYSDRSYNRTRVTVIDNGSKIKSLSIGQDSVSNHGSLYTTFIDKLSECNSSYSSCTFEGTSAHYSLKPEGHEKAVLTVKACDNANNCVTAEHTTSYYVYAVH